MKNKSRRKENKKPEKNIVHTGTAQHSTAQIVFTVYKKTKNKKQTKKYLNTTRYT